MSRSTRPGFMTRLPQESAIVQNAIRSLAEAQSGDRRTGEKSKGYINRPPPRMQPRR
ncbi:MAG TPA: hypothetical protein VJC11_00605 [Patescibacteria group bacterium]|nr:hypothetical protein [Patescibacteria group bacterium]